MNCSSLIRSSSVSSVMPALDTSTSTGPCSASTAANAASTAARVGHVALDAEQAVGRAAAAVGHGDPVALGGEGPGDGQADAAVAAGDEHGSGHEPEPYSPAVRAIQITEFGGPEVLRLVELPDPEPAGGLVVHEVTAAGVNYADTHQTEDSYLAKQELPLVPGAEFVGLAPDGSRVVGLLAGGGYAERVLAAPALTWPVPDGVSDGAALAVVLQGLTAWHALRTCAHLAAGESVLVHAAAGGVGTLAVQLAKLWGAGRVIATASSPDKRELARSLGADEVVDPAAPDLVDALRAANGGRRVDVVLEMVGGPVFDASLRATGARSAGWWCTGRRPGPRRPRSTRRT